MKPRTSSLRAILLVLAGVTSLALSSATASTILIDFGPSSGNTSGNWNNSNLTGAGTVSSNLIDSTGALTGYAFAITSVGTTMSIGSSGLSGGVGIYPNSATIDYQAENPGSNVVMTLSGLSQGIAYTFTYLSSRQGSPAGTYTTELDFQGAGALVQTNVDSTANSTLITSGPIFANSSGNIVITQFSPANHSFSYLNVLQIDSVPEPSTVALAILGGLGLFVVVLRRRQNAAI